MTEILDILKSGPAVWAAAIAVFAAFLKSAKSFFEFHDEHLQKRQLKRLAFLAKECETNPVLTQLITAAKEEEIFRNLYRRTASPEFVSALTRLHETGRFSLSELRASSFYLKLVNGSIAVELGWTARIIFWVSLGLVAIMGLYVTALLTLLFHTPSAAALLAAIVLLAFYFFFAWFIGSDARAVNIAKGIQEKLVQIQNAT